MAPVSNLMSPLLWQSVPFGDRDSFLDFLAVHNLWHQLLAQKTKTAYVSTDDLGGAWRLLLGQGFVAPKDVQVTPSELLRHAQMHKAEATALGLAPASDLISADLNERASYYAWMQSHALEHTRLRQAVPV